MAGVRLLVPPKIPLNGGHTNMSTSPASESKLNFAFFDVSEAMSDTSFSIFISFALIRGFFCNLNCAVAKHLSRR